MKTLGSNQDPRLFAVELTKPPWQTVLPTMVILSLKFDKFIAKTPQRQMMTFQKLTLGMVWLSDWVDNTGDNEDHFLDPHVVEVAGAFWKFSAA